MRKTLTHIRNYLFLRRLIKNPKIITNKDRADTFIETSIKIAKRFKWNGYMKKLLLRVIKSLRKIYPHKTGEYDAAKKMYEEYFTLGNHIPSLNHIREKLEKGEEVYIVQFRRKAPVKGKMWCEYYINQKGSGENIVYKCTKIRHFIYRDVVDTIYIDYNSIKDQANASENYDYNSGSLEESFLTCFLYATEDQIETFDQKVERVKQLETLVTEKQTEVRKLQEEINLVCNFE